MLIIDCKKNRNGFTIVELVIVMVVIGIITASSTFAYGNIQKRSRDSQRLASAVVVSEGLEKYYAANGDYPSVARMIATDATSVKQLLKFNNLDSLVAPNAAPGTTINIWNAGNATSTNKLTYTGNTDNSASCLTGASATNVCDDYKIQYYEENPGTVQTIYSRSKAPAAPATPPDPIIAAPVPPTLIAALSGGNVVATRSDTTCRAGAITLYSFRSRTNDGTWGSYSAWNSDPTTSTAAAQGVKFGFQIKAKCLEGDYSSSDAVSNEATYIHPINTPTAPVLTVTPAVDSATATWNWSATSCPTGASAQYDTQFYRDDPTAWRAYDGSTQGNPSVVYATNYEGYDHRARAKARCVSTFATSAWSADSNSPSFISPVTAPAGATNFRWSTYNGGPLFTWTESSCGLGTQQERRYWKYTAGTQYFANGSTPSQNKSTWMIFNATRAGADTFAQWESDAAFAASQLDFTIVNQRAYESVAIYGPGWMPNVGSPNTNSQNDYALKTVVQLRCINTVTGRNAAGIYVMSGMFNR